VFFNSFFVRLSIGLGVMACSACAGSLRKPDDAGASATFYTVMAEIALARGEARVGAQQYLAAAQVDAGISRRAAEVAEAAQQPDLALRAAGLWLREDPASLEAHRAAGSAALSLYLIEQSALHYQFVLSASPKGTEAEFAALETELQSNDNAFGARRLADRLAALFPASAAALRMQGFAALRADDPAAALRSFGAALAHPGDESDEARRELRQAMLRARVITGDGEAALAESQAQLARSNAPADRLDYAVLLLAAKRDDLARGELGELAHEPALAPAALRILGLVDYQDGHFDAAGLRFTELLTAGRFVDDAFYYLGLIAERRDNLEQAVRLYAQVQNGEYAIPALLRAASILYAHGAPVEAEQLLDRLARDEPGHAPEAYSARARMYADAGALPQSIAVLDEGILEYPCDMDLRYTRASSYEDQGRIQAALAELTAVLKIRSEDPAAMNALGYTLADHSLKLLRARALIEQAHAAAPDNAAIRDSLGWVLYRQGYTAQALPYLSSAYADEPGGDIGAHLGEVLWRLGRQADADQIWSEAGALEAGNRLLKATRQRLHAAQ
jgi:hypothetical protein